MTRLAACVWFVAQVLGSPAAAQFAQPLGPGSQQSGGGYADPANGFTSSKVPLLQGVPNSPPYSPPMQGSPPPPGDGDAAQEVTAGDRGAPLPPSSGNADMTHGNLFPAGQGKDRTTVYIYSQGKSGRGSRMVQTIRPSALTEKQKNDIGGILGINMDSGEESINANASESQLAQIQNILAPYPNADNEGGRTKINDDAPGNGANINKEVDGRKTNESLYTYQGPLPTVRTFARYLVILGVVSATVWMALAAYSMVMGNPYGGARVVSAAAGLMLLLCSYTIWKIVQMNTFKDNSNSPAQNRFKVGGDEVSNPYTNPPKLPATPDGGRPGTGRLGIPLEPLGASINR